MDRELRELMPTAQEVLGPVCVLCESGYHDHAWEVSHIQECGCPCHVSKAQGIGHAAGIGN